MELNEIGRAIRTPFEHHTSSFPSVSTGDSIKEEVDEIELQWAAIERLPTFTRLKTSLVDQHDDTGESKQQGKKVADVTRLGALERKLFIEKLINDIENDNRRLLEKLRERIDRVDVKLPTVEVRYKNLSVEADCEVVQGKPLPTLRNTLKSILYDLTKFTGWTSQEARMSVLKDVNGIIKPSRMTLLLGPPGCGKTTLLLALAGKLNKSLQVTGEISYNGYRLNEFVPQKTSAYISQNDLHIPEMTVRETLDFSALCLGVGSRAEIMKEISRREKQAGIFPDPEIDTYMKATSAEDLRGNLQTDYTLKILGLDICADTMVGDTMRRGISGGQKRRLTTGEMIVGPMKTLFMDEISTGLDTSTTFQIVTCIQQFVHMADATVLISLLQPAPETFDLFDDVILMAEGTIIYHGPRTNVLEFFEDFGFKCPERKGIADFLQEVISRKDQAQYWYNTTVPYSFVSITQFSERFKASYTGQKLDEELSEPCNKPQHQKNALSFNSYSLSKWKLLKACTAREALLMKRHSFVYIFKIVQLVLIAFITMTMFIRTRMAVDLLHANYYMGALFYTLVRLMTNGVAEVAFTNSRLPVFYKQRELHFYPAWAYSIPACILKIPISMVESFIWTAITYYVIGYSPEVERFLRQYLLLFALYQASVSMCRLIASVFQNMVSATTFGNLVMLMMFLFGGFILPKPSLPPWLKWGFWLFPMSYGEIGLSLNEFLAPRWQKGSSTNTTGGIVLTRYGLNYDGYFYWISVGVLFGFSMLFEIGFFIALTHLKPPGKSRAIISREKLSQLQGGEDNNKVMHLDRNSTVPSPVTVLESRKAGKMILPFEPLTVTFQSVHYFVEIPQVIMKMSENGTAPKELQLLSNVTGAFRPGVLTALMGVSGAGKTTLMDVLCGRKTGGRIEGDIRIGGYPKVQQTFARVSGYCEQTDIHSPQITVEESLTFSARLRLPPQIDTKTKSEFVREVLETIELEEVKDNLVGIPGKSGLSTEQRKRLTIAVELVSNPFIIFMDEPTSGLDARAAAIVMRAVKNVVATGRTTVCTIHQPSIDIFEAFDELILMKRGGLIMYSGSLGQHSTKLIRYFQGISGIPKIKDNHNPATWMLEVTSPSMEANLGLDFANIYEESSLHQETIEVVKQLNQPPPGSRDLQFPTRFPQNGWQQFKACLWKEHLSYWRSPEYNLVRFTFTIIASILFGAVFWRKGKKINEEQDLFNILGSMYSAVIFLGLSNCSTILPFVFTERTVLYRERFAGMYSSKAYSLAQVMIEIPYIMSQAIIYTAITYPTIGYYGSAYKVFWYLYGTFCTLLYYTYLGMLIVALSSNIEVASILAAALNTMLNLFAGFLIPGPKIPGWWIWCYWICPTAWTINGLFTSQYGDIHKEIVIFGQAKTVSSFLQDYYGFHHDRLVFVALVLIAFPIAFAFLFSYFIGKLNFQRR